MRHGLSTHVQDPRQQSILRSAACGVDGIPKYVLTPLSINWIVKRRPWAGSMSYDEVGRKLNIESVCAVTELVKILDVPPLAREWGLCVLC